MQQLPPLTFLDVPADAWYRTYIDQATSWGIVNGYKDNRANLTGYFGPDDKLTIGQSVKIVLLSAGYNMAVLETAQPGRHWAQPYLDKARELDFALLRSGIVNPDAPATRAQVASLLTDAFKVRISADIIGARYKDLKPTIIFAQAIDSLSRDGIIGGDTDLQGNPIGTVRPADTIVRAEAVKMAVLARQKYGMPGGMAASEGLAPSVQSSWLWKEYFFSSSSTSSQGI